MALVSTNKIQALGVPDARIGEDTLEARGVGATDSDYEQAGARAGLPAPDQPTAMVLDASGEQTDLGDLEIYTLRSGNPGHEEGGFVHRDVLAGDTTTEYLGWDGYQVVTGVESLFRSPGTGAGGSLIDVLRLDDGTVLMAHQKASAASGVELQRYDPAGGAWALVGTISANQAASSQPCCCMVQLLPEGSVLYFLLNDDARNVVIIRSDPAGFVTGFGGVMALRRDLPAGAVITEMRAAYNNDQIVLFIRYTPSGGGDEVAQYASTDRGAHFDVVAADWGVAGDAPKSISVTALAAGGFLFVYDDGQAATPRYRSRRIGSALEDVQNADDVVIVALAPGATDTITVWSDEDGAVYCIAAFTEAASSGTRLFRSIDLGDSWDAWGAPVTELDPGKVTNRLVEFAATSTAGRGLLVSRYISGDAESDSAVVCLFLGGPSRFTVPATNEDVGGVPTPTTNFLDVSFITWAISDDNAKAGGFYLPTDLPQNSGWTKAGAGTETIDANQRLAVVSAGNNVWYSRTHAGDLQRVVLEFAVELHVGEGNLAAAEMGLIIRLADNGGYQYTVTVRLDEAGFRVFDDEGAAAVGTVTGLDLTSGVFHFALAMSGNGGGAASGDVLTWYAVSTAVAHARRWEVGPAGTVDDGGATANDNGVEFGNIANGAVTSDWAFVGYNFWPHRWSAMDDASTSFASAWSNPNHIHPRSYSPLPLLLEDDVHIAAKDGPSYIAETWRIEPVAEYAITNMLVGSNSTPRRQWRSLQDNIQQLASWKLDADFASSRMLNHSIALIALNSNLETIVVETWNGAAWVALATLDSTTDWAALDYDRRGGAIIPRAGMTHTGERYLWRSAHVGDTFVINEGGANTYHKIKANTEGAWIGQQSDTKKPTIVLGRDNLPGALADQAFGVGEIRRKDFGAVVHSYNSDHQYIRLRIPQQFTADGDYRIGQLLIAPLAVFAHEYDSGWSVTREFDSEVFRRTGGTRRGRKRGPSRRVVEIAWANTAVDASRAQAAQPSPDYVVGQTGVALAIGAVQDAIRLVEGIHVEQDGPVDPVVYLSRVPTDAAGSHALSDWREFVFGRLEANPRVDNVTGDEAKTELERLNTITISEEV